MDNFLFILILILNLVASQVQAEESCEEYDLRSPGESLFNLGVRDQMDQSICYGTSAAQAMDAYLNTVRPKSQPPWITSDMDAAVDGKLVEQTRHVIQTFQKDHFPRKAATSKSSKEECSANEKDIEKIFRDNREDPTLNKLWEMLEVGIPKTIEHSSQKLPYDIGYYCDSFNALKIYGACSEDFRVQNLKQRALANNKALLGEGFTKPDVRPLNLQKIIFNYADCVFSNDKPQSTRKFMSQAYSLKLWSDEVFLQSFHKQCPPNIRRSVADAPECQSTALDSPWFAAINQYFCGDKRGLKEKLALAQREAETEFNQILGNRQPRLPTAISFYASLLWSDKNGVEKPTDETHIALVIGRRKKGNSCQYLLRNSWGKGCNYKNQKINSNCESGDLWLDSTDLLPKVTWAYVLK